MRESRFGADLSKAAPESQLLRWLVRYGSAVAAVLLSYLLRRLLSLVAPDLPSYITFYPAIMLVALIAGFWPGLVATATAALIVAVWVLPPIGRFPIDVGTDLVGLALFTSMGVFMSVVAQLYRRSRQKSAAYEKELALRESEERFRAVYEQAAVGIALLDPEGRFLRANSGHCRILDREEQDLIGRSLFELVLPEEVEEYRRSWQDLLAGRIGSSSLEKRERKKDGSYAWVRSTRSVVRATSGQPQYVISVIEDVSARKEAEQALKELNETLERQVHDRTAVAERRARQLQALAVELCEAEERERARIADLLHDDLQQILASAKIQLQAARPNLPALAALDKIDELLGQSILQSRHLSHELSPAMLAHSELPAALKQLAAETKERYGLEVAFEAGELCDQPDNALRAFLYRSVKELLFNVVKHAGAKSARLSLSGSPTHLTVAVSDSGQGFDPQVLDPSADGAAAPVHSGYGLLTIRERVRAVGGSLVITSSPGEGSRIQITLPLPSRRQAPQSGERPVLRNSGRTP